MESKYEDIPFRASKLLTALRETGYDTYTAIMDIIDNSIDADATNIDIIISKREDDIIIDVADNGYGMNVTIIKEALALGSDTEKDEKTDLGKFGMGLTTGGFSIGKSIEIISKENSNKYFYGHTDLDNVESTGKYQGIFNEANSNQEAKFSQIIGDNSSGTLVTISKSDNLTSKDVNRLKSTLIKRVGEVFRKFIDSNKITIKINGIKVKSYDPITLGFKETKGFSYDEYEYLYNGKKYFIEAKICILPEFSQGKNKELGINQKNQGFYLMRNNRQIAAGKTFNLFEKHNSMNRIRIELSFNADMDKFFGVRFKKDGISMKQSLECFIQSEIIGQISTASKNIKSEKKHIEQNEIDFTEVEENIKRKGKLLITPKAEKEIINPETNIIEKVPIIKGNISKEKIENTVFSNNKGVTFEQEQRGSDAPFYQCGQEGKLIIIYWNTDHPFYEKVILPNKDFKDNLTGVNYLIYALAVAELKFLDDNSEMAEQFRVLLSTNLRTLLS